MHLTIILSGWELFHLWMQVIGGLALGIQLCSQSEKNCQVFPLVATLTNCFTTDICEEKKCHKKNVTNLSHVKCITTDICEETNVTKNVPKKMSPTKCHKKFHPKKFPKKCHNNNLSNVNCITTEKCVKKKVLIGIVHQFCFYRSNLIFWIVMGCGTAAADHYSKYEI